MCKKLIYFSYLLLLFTSCEEYYTPVIDTVGGQLVVEALLTNDASKNFVRLTKTRSFYDKLPPLAALNAKVALVGIDGIAIRASESIPGNFTFNSIPVAGKNYKLRITYNNDTYESEMVMMPPVPTYDNFYTENVEKKIYKTDGDGVPSAHYIQGREVYIDAPVSSVLSYYRFETRSISEWVYAPPGLSGPAPPPLYGWQSFFENSKFNIAGPKKFSQNEKIEKQPLTLLSYRSSDYLESDSLVSLGWILIIDQFGTSKGSYEYHEKLNSQFAADGSLFDPIQTQVYGNITCITDHSKNVFGYFDLNSYKQFRYYLYITGPEYPGTLRQIFRYPNIPYAGESLGFTPDWWERN
jgi:hypothetical protein